ncbi:hypothetical protein NMY22_g12046 [Coprinellus aureogranulatus]|nr:hypothetical protein NMY22_g12046 [Coprinellus aureogranulatus]
MTGAHLDQARDIDDVLSELLSPLKQLRETPIPVFDLRVQGTQFLSTLPSTPSASSSPSHLSISSRPPYNREYIQLYLVAFFSISISQLSKAWKSQKPPRNTLETVAFRDTLAFMGFFFALVHTEHFPSLSLVHFKSQLHWEGDSNCSRADDALTVMIGCLEQRGQSGRPLEELRVEKSGRLLGADQVTLMRRLVPNLEVVWDEQDVESGSNDAGED